MQQQQSLDGDLDIVKFVANVTPLDTLTFHGADFVSDTISMLEQGTEGSGAATHVGLAMSREWCPAIKKIAGKDMLVWESIMSGPLNDGVMNVETGKTKFGSQFRNLHDVVKAYTAKPKGNIGLAKLKNNPCVKKDNETDKEFLKRKKQLKSKLNKAYKKYNDRTYNLNPLDLFSAIFPALRPLRDLDDETLGKLLGTDDWLFCSQLVAVVYKDLGIAAGDFDYRDASPVDFLSHSGNPADKEHSIFSALVETPVWLKPVL